MNIENYSNLEDAFQKFFYITYHLLKMKKEGAPEIIITQQVKSVNNIKKNIIKKLNVIREDIFDNLTKTQINSMELPYCPGCINSLKKRDDGTFAQYGDEDFESNYCSKNMVNENGLPTNDCPDFASGDWVKWDEHEKNEKEKLHNLKDNSNKFDIYKFLQVLSDET